MANFGPLTAEICRRFGAPQQISTGFASWLSLLQRRRQPEANQTLHSAGTLYIHFRGLLPSDGILPGAKFTLRPGLAFSYVGSITARHSSSEHTLAKLCGMVQGMELRNFRRGRHIYSARRPSRWASAQISSFLSVGQFVRSACSLFVLINFCGTVGLLSLL